ncbi:MAG TPA: hypothetical protein VKU02_26345 [Gemmataceae bacterium]|nr:hypothetical protein [Gemmataceae bacterium]
MGFSTHGSFLYTGGTYIALDFPGAVQTDAYGINNAGQIVGDYTDLERRQHGFLGTPSLAPVPEPSALVLLMMIMVSVVAYLPWCRRCSTSAGLLCRPQSSQLRG